MGSLFSRAKKQDRTAAMAWLKKRQETYQDRKDAGEYYLHVSYGDGAGYGSDAF